MEALNEHTKNWLGKVIKEFCTSWENASLTVDR